MSLSGQAFEKLFQSFSQHTPFIEPKIDLGKLNKFYGGHVAALTGAGSGIGRAIAINLAKLGCNLALSDVNEAKLHDTKLMLEEYGITVTTTVLDVSNQSAVYKWADEVVNEHGKVNFIFNNAGVALLSTVEGTSIADFEWLMNINFWGVVYGTKAFLPLIKNSVKLAKQHKDIAKNGHIINISSLFGLTSQPTQSAYNASKFAVRGFTESLRQELDIENCGVSTTCVHPGGIKTDIANNARGNTSVEALGIDAGEVSIKRFNKMLTFDPDMAAKIILMATANNEKRCLIGDDARTIDVIQRVFPSHYGTIVTKIAKRAKAKTGRKRT